MRPVVHWADDGAPSGAETINKIRNGVSRDTGVDRLWAFYERPMSGQRFLISREVGHGLEFRERAGFGSGL